MSLNRDCTVLKNYSSKNFERTLLNDHEICKANNRRKKNFLTVLPIFTPSLYTNAFKALKTTSKIPPKVSCGKPKHRSI